MKKILPHIIIAITILFSINAYAQTDTEFWFVVPEIDQEHNDRPIRFVFTTTDFPADITIEMPANGAFTPINISLPANTTDWIEYSAAADIAMFENRTVMDEIGTGGASISNKGIRITSTAPITCYYEVNTTNNSDIWSLKGSNGLGTEFYIPFQDIGQNRHKNHDERGWSSIEIIGTGATTVVEVYPSKAVYRNATITSETNMYTVTLEKGEVYTLPPAWDPTIPHGSYTGWFGVYRDQHIGGTYIRVQSGDPVAVVVKDDSVTEDIGESTDSPSGGWDIIADQWVPLNILGTEYVAMRGTLINSDEKIFAVATEDDTRIWWEFGGIDTTDALINAAVNAEIDKGEQVRIDFPNTQAYKYIISNKKISVLHVSGVGTEMGGAVLPPIDKCTGSTTVGFTRSKPDEFHMNIMVRTTAKDGFLVNGAAPTFFDEFSFDDIPGTPWSVARIQNISTLNVPVNVTTTISNTKDVFHLGIINETNGGAGCRFGYFSDFNEVQISALSLQGGEQPSSTPRACIGDSIQLFASGGTNYEWWPADDLSSTTISNPKTLVTGYKVYYVKVSGFCNQSDTASISITPLTQPEADFMLSSPSGCSPLDVEIRNVSKNVSRMYWDFNTTLIDGAYDQDTTIFKKVNGNDSLVVALDSTFTHRFENTSFEPLDTPQVYNIKLKVKTAKCFDSLSTSITVYPEVTADFTLSDLDDTLSCNPAVVDFQATALSINEDYYKWDFGDGALSSAGDTVHEYVNLDPENDANFTARLIARSEWFCRDTAYQDFTVHPYLEGGFTIDTDEGCSPLTVRIDNISSGADSIFLDYGDGTIDTLLSFDSVNHLYRNNDGVDEVDTNIIVMRVKNDEGCEYTDRDTILVYPEFEANFSIDPYNNCNRDTVTFNNLTNNGTHLASRYLWEFADGTSMDTTNNTIDKYYNNNTTGDKTYNFRLTARSVYGCTDDTTNSIIMNRAFADFTVDNIEGCTPVTVTINNNSVGNQITNWDWDYGDGHTDTDEDPFPYSYINSGFENDTNMLVLEVTGTAGCSSKDSVQIVVYPQIKAVYTTVLTSVPSCDSLVAKFNCDIFDPSLSPVYYTWNFGDGASSSASDPTHVFKNLLSSTPQNRRVDLHVETDMGCSYDTSSFITVDPRVKAHISINKSVDCSPLTVDVKAQTFPGNNSYDWDYGDLIGSNSNIDPVPYTYPANQSYTLGGDANYELILEVEDVNNRCIDRDTIDITVYSETNADFTSDVNSGCNPLYVNFTDLSEANVVDWQWNFGNGATSTEQNPEQEFENTEPVTWPFNTKLSVTSDRGCTDSITKQINVLPYIEADFGINKSSGCSPLTVTISNYSSGTQYYWYWDKDDNIIDAAVLAAADSTTSQPTFTKKFYNSSGVSRTDSLTLIVGNGNGCYEIFKRAITVHSSVTADFTFNQPDSCTSSDVTFTDASIPAVGGYKYNWNFDDGSNLTTTSPTVNKTFENNDPTDRLYLVTLNVETPQGCTSYYSENVTVYSKLVADFSIPVTAKCPPFENATIINTSYGDPNNRYDWYVDGSPTPDQTIIGTGNFVRDYDNTDHLNVRPYNIRLVATNEHGCTSEKTGVINVYEKVTADFSINTEKSCSPLEAEFTNNSLVPTGTTYMWDFSDGVTSGLKEPDHDFINSSRTDSLKRTVYLTVQSPNFCTDDTSMQVTIYHKPLANFYISKTSSCPPLQSTLINESDGENYFQWRFGDGNFSTTANDTIYEWDNTDIDNIQNYKLELWVGTDKNCVDSTSLSLSVFPKVTADFTMTNSLGNPVTGGCSPLEGVQFTNTSTSPATQFFWTFGDGTTSNLENPVHDFANIGSNDRTYDIFLKASSEYNCVDDTTQQVTVYVQPDAEFYLEPDLMIFPQNTVNLSNETNFGPFEYYWEFGDINNSTSTSEDPVSFEYEHWGEKIINLEVTSTTNNNCTDLYSDTLTILPPNVIANFVTDIDAACLNEGVDIQFTAGLSPYNETYLYEWDFGDGSPIETDRIVNHSYDTSGTYFVKLIVRSNETGAQQNEAFVYKTIQIHPNPFANLEILPTEAMLNSKEEARVEFFNLSECNDELGCSYVWDFGDGNTAISKDVTHNYTELGEYDVSLLVTSSKGCKDSILLEKAVKIIGEGEIKLPNAFTPNNDGLNDYFKPVSKGVVKYELLIYNRWGELIFKTNDLNKGWDGTINGELAKADVYVWKAVGRFTNGKTFEIAGDITLIR